MDISNDQRKTYFFEVAVPDWTIAPSKKHLQKRKCCFSVNKKLYYAITFENGGWLIFIDGATFDNR